MSSMENPILIKKGTWKDELKMDDKTFYLKIKTERMESVVTVMEPRAEMGETFTHEGEEVHMVIDGVVEFEVDGKSYILEKGDWLWHESTLPHHSRNLTDEKARYITIGSPPTFM
jgi:mannose-6-phosphate isomerase-like protein (cupin superfamily)